VSEPHELAALWSLFEQVWEREGPEWPIEALFVRPESTVVARPPEEPPGGREQARPNTAVNAAGRSSLWALPLVSSLGLGGGLAQNLAGGLAASNERTETGGAGWLWKALGGGLGLAPLVAGIWALFGGRKQAELPELTKYLLPTPVRMAAGYQEGSRTPWVGEVSYDERSRPRAAELSPGNGSGARQVVVQVNALDTQSFLDRSDEIALAVRRAMLNMNALNDVVAEL